MKKFIILIIYLIFLCTGCTYNEINNLAIANSVGIDYEDGMYTITLQIMDLNTENNKSSNIDDIIDEYGLKNPILIGDTISDLKAAKNSNILFVQSCYGFGAPIYNKSVNSFDEFLTAMEKGEIWK